MRTCVGCRARAGKSELLRVTARDGQLSSMASRLPDPGNRAVVRTCTPPRPVWIGRSGAGRSPGPFGSRAPLDITALREWIEAARTTRPRSDG